MWSLDELTKKILSIDLSSGQIIKSQEAPELYRYFLGGRGLDQYYLYNLLDPATYSDKGKLVAYHERFHAVLNSLGLCFFTSRWVGNDLLDEQDYADVVATSTGWEMEASELMLIGERIHNVERLFNAHHADLDRKDDYPADRFFCEPIKSGPFKGAIIDRDQFDSMLNQNYVVHGWDKQGLPKMETLRTLELDLLLKRLPGFLHQEKV